MQYQSNEIKDLALALSKAQAEMESVIKDSQNPYYNSKYANLPSTWKACKKALTNYELSVSQTMRFNEHGQLCLVTSLLHSSGQWRDSYLPIKFDESLTELNKYGKEVKANPLQKMGSCLTYLRRYAISCIVCVCPDDEEDDDGNQMEGQPYQVSIPKKPEPAVAQSEPLPPPPPIPRMSDAQVAQIEQVITPEYKKELLTYFGERMGAKSLKDIPARRFEEIYKAASKRKEANSEKEMRAS